MTLTSSGQISISDINGEFGRSGTTANSSLEDLSDGTVATINTANDSADRPDGSAPHNMTEFYSYNHSAASTSWSNVPADFNLHTLDGSNFSVDSVVSGAKSITLSGGSGTTSVSCQQPSNGNIDLKVAVSTSGDPGTSGTANSGTGFNNNAPSISFTSGTLYLRFKLVEVKANSGNLNTAEDRTITFTNNSVSNTDLQINCRLSGL
tara:strand:- start:15378 stop:15998 length:621 start_codon:yes stop_codon:yes gene_type:complete